MFREKIQKALQKVTELDAVRVDAPVQDIFGDYSSNVALQSYKDTEIKVGSVPEHLARKAGVKVGFPRQEAERIKNELEKDESLMEFIDKIEIAGPGFLNFWIKKEALLAEVQKIEEGKDKYGTSDNHKGQKVVVEYSSPNIAKPFTIGHLRSTLIGDAIANLLEATSWTVYRDNHLGDWGTQFGKQIYAIKTWGNEEQIESSENPVKELVALYVKFHEEAEKDPSIEDKGREWFKKLEDGDEEAKELWKKCIDWSMKEFGEYYKLLGISFTENNGLGYGESFFEDKMTRVLNELEAKGLLKEGKEGAKLIFFPDEKYPPLMIIKKDGATLYGTRDLATDKFRLEKYGKDVQVIVEVGAEQALYQAQVAETEIMLGWYKPGQRYHLQHGFFRFADKKMSTRKGNVIWLKDVLEEAVKRSTALSMKSGDDDKDVKTLARQVAIGALKWNELKRDSIKDIIFDWDEILNMEGNSGPYLQYTYARAQSVLNKAQVARHEALAEEQIKELVANDEELSVLRQLVHFGEAIEDAAENYAPNILCTYLYGLAQKFNAFYNKHRILEAENTSKDFRLILTAATGQVLQNGLHLLGIETPEKM